MRVGGRLGGGACPWARAMMELLGRVILAVEAFATTVVMLMAYQAHARNQTLDYAVVLCFVLGHTYSTATLFLGAVVPVRLVYEHHHVLEMMHRSRYLVFDCCALPCVCTFFL